MKVLTERKYIKSNGNRIKLLILKPDIPQQGEKKPGILWIHGGGYITGMAEMVYMSRSIHLVKKYGVTVISPEYRLSGQAPYPAALIDCYHALLYMKKHTEELGIRKNQIMVGGESAGGGLAAALCMYAKDKRTVNIAYQMPLYPMIDNEDTETSRDNHAPVWNTRRNHYGWKQYLKGITGEKVPAYAAPARRKDYSGLPPAYTFVCTSEPFYAETITYVRNMQEAGIDARIDIYPGMFHAFDMLLPFLPISKRAAEGFEKNFEYAMAHYFSEQGEA